MHEKTFEDISYNLKQFVGKTFVIKYGGSIMKNVEAKNAFIEDVVRLRKVGIHIIIVHGGGPYISELLNKLKIQTQFVKGLRVTDEKTMEVVEMVLSGKVNKEITGQLCRMGADAIGISGIDRSFIEAKKKYIYEEDKKIDIGCVGNVERIHVTLLKDLLDKNYIPVISPVGCDQEGGVYNINADYVAAAVSTAIKAEKLILLTDVAGIYRDINDPSSFVSKIDVEEIKDYIQCEKIVGGMIPKMECCMHAVENGVNNVHLIDGRKSHSLLLNMLEDEGLGTIIGGKRGCQKIIS
ncbi:acetylglutamate kinase [Clostridiaceae bacterium 35-E11]